jgi:hypothetical protein
LVGRCGSRGHPRGCRRWVCRRFWSRWQGGGTSITCPPSWTRQAHVRARGVYALAVAVARRTQNCALVNVVCANGPLPRCVAVAVYPCRQRRDAPVDLTVGGVSEDDRACSAQATAADHHLLYRIGCEKVVVPVDRVKAPNHRIALRVSETRTARSRALQSAVRRWNLEVGARTRAVDRARARDVLAKNECCWCCCWRCCRRCSRRTDGRRRRSRREGWRRGDVTPTARPAVRTVAREASRHCVGAHIDVALCGARQKESAVRAVHQAGAAVEDVPDCVGCKKIVVGTDRVETEYVGVAACVGSASRARCDTLH